MKTFTDEIWKPVVGYEDQYEVSSLGRVRSLPKTVPHIKGTRTIPARVLKPQRQSSGHLYIRSLGGRNGKLAWIHRLVYEAFVGPIPEGMDIRHLDGDPSKNTPENLMPGTRVENAHDVYAYGGRYRKLRREDVIEIRRRLSAGEPQRLIAKDFAVSCQTISNINTRKTFNYI